jgi:hypothetical protein
MTRRSIVTLAFLILNGKMIFHFKTSPAGISPKSWCRLRDIVFFTTRGSIVYGADVRRLIP